MGPPYTIMLVAVSGMLISCASGPDFTPPAPPRVAAGSLGAQRAVVNGAPSGLPDGERTFNLFTAGIGVSYNFDLAGGNRRILESLAAQVDYRSFVLEGARLTLAANVASAAVLQAQLRAQIDVAADIVKNQEEQLALIRHRIRLGMAARKEYSLGAAGYLEMLIARRQADGLRIAVIDSQTRRLFDTIALYGAMGGGI